MARHAPRQTPEDSRQTVTRLITESYEELLSRLQPSSIGQEQILDEIATLNDQWNDILLRARTYACQRVTGPRTTGRPLRG